MGERSCRQEQRPTRRSRRAVASSPRSDPHAAAVALERARDLEPDKGSIRETLGRAYFRSGRFPAAATEFARAVELDPVNDYAHFGLGLALSARG